MKNLTNLFIKLLVFFAVTGIIFILTLINTKLLLFLNWYKIGHDFDKYFAIISGIAYALGSISVVIWYNPKLKLNANAKEIKQFRIKKVGSVILKLAFVTLDGIHVFVYQNLTLEEKYIPAIASIVFALQTVLILYFIGSVVDDIIKHQTENDNNKSEFKKLQTKFSNVVSELVKTKSKFAENENYYNTLLTDFRKLESEFKNNKSQLQENQTKIEQYASNIAECKSKFKEVSKEKEIAIDKLENLTTKIKQKDKHITELEKYFYKSEKSRILKKNEANRTEEERQILTDAEEIL